MAVPLKSRLASRGVRDLKINLKLPPDVSSARRRSHTRAQLPAMTAGARTKLLAAMVQAKRAGNLAELPRLFARLVRSSPGSPPPAAASNLMLQACDWVGDVRCREAVLAVCDLPAGTQTAPRPTWGAPRDSGAAAKVF